MLQAVIFDLDGTLWDSSRGVAESWAHVCKQNPSVGREITRADIQGIMGLMAEAIAEKLLGHLPHDERMELLFACMAYEQEHLARVGGELYAGLEATLAQLSGRYKLFIVSNCEDGYIQTFFAAHGLQKYFADFESAGGTGMPKGDNIALIMRRNRVQNAVYVGDTQGDADAARQAQVPFIWAEYGFGSTDAPDYSIQSLAQLPGLLSQLEQAK